MNSHYTYLLLDAATLLFPLLFSFDKKVAFYRHWQALIGPLLVTGTFFIIWDILFTRQGVWSFNPHYLTGIGSWNLPLEEWLFFLVVPYACAFIYACLPAYVKALSPSGKGWPALLTLGIALTIVGLIFYHKAYTFTSFTFCGLTIIGLYLLRRHFTAFRPHTFLIAYTICLIPFFIVNGILTALPVVIYNNAENLGIRMYTIPFEDTFYGMLLVLGVVAGMERNPQKIK